MNPAALSLRAGQGWMVSFYPFILVLAAHLCSLNSKRNFALRFNNVPVSIDPTGPKDFTPIDSINAETSQALSFCL